MFEYELRGLIAVLEKVILHCEECGLAINYDKTFGIHFRKSRRCRHEFFEVRGHKVTVEQYAVKYLGGTIDHKGDWGPHIDILSKKAGAANGKLRAI